MATYLDKIVDYKKEELEAARRKTSQKDLELKAADSDVARPFLKNFQNGKINIIAEVKKASPSAGVIRPDFNPVDIAHIYEDYGAKALSVLTDENFFQGSLDYLIKIKKAVGLPCLRKDFTLHQYHIFEARAHGADAILLIAAILEPAQLKDYSDLASELGMTTLFEIHDENDWKKISALNPKLVGVNNRNLQTFETKLEASTELRPLLEKVPTRISESGLKTHDDLVKLLEAGYQGFLIGETLMREQNIGSKFKEMIGS